MKSGHMPIGAGLLTTVLLPVALAAQSAAATQTKKAVYIVDCYIAEVAEGSGYESGPMNIVYSDGRHIVEDLPPKQKSTPEQIAFNTEGFASAQLADDRQTVGWAVQVDNCCTSYTIPIGVTIFRSGKVIRSILTGQMVWNWMFRPGGQQVVIVAGPTHGTTSGDFRLYDVKSGKLLAEVFGNEEDGSPPPNAPQWAKDMYNKKNTGTSCKEPLGR